MLIAPKDSLVINHLLILLLCSSSFTNSRTLFPCAFVSNSQSSWLLREDIGKSCFPILIHLRRNSANITVFPFIYNICHALEVSLTTKLTHHPREQDKEATVYVGNLDERVTDSLIWELMLQAGRIANVHLPKDRVTQTHQGYGFVEFQSEEDAEYAAKIMNQVRLWGKPIRVNKASADKQKTLEVGAELFVGNLDPMVDEKVLFETFGRFGSLTSAPKVSFIVCP